MTEKQKYIGAYLDGYFSDKKLRYGLQYFSILENATKKAEKKWKHFCFLTPNKMSKFKNKIIKNGI